MIEIKKLYAFVAVNDEKESVLIRDNRKYLTADQVVIRGWKEGLKLGAPIDFEIRLVEFERKEGFEVIK